jgi:hypothetical protein
MELENQAANPGTEPTEPVAPAEPTPEPTAPAEPKSTETTTQAFSRRLNERQKEWEQKHSTEFKYASEMQRIATRLGHPNVEAFIEAQDRWFADQGTPEPESKPQTPPAEPRGADKTQERVTTLEDKFNQLARRDEIIKAAETYTKDNPSLAKFFEANKAEIMQTARENMAGLTNSAADDLDTAVMVVLREKYQEPDMAALKQQHIKEYQDELRGKAKPVESRGGGIPSAPAQTTGRVDKDCFNNALARLTAKPE